MAEGDERIYNGANAISVVSIDTRKITGLCKKLHSKIVKGTLKEDMLGLLLHYQLYKFPKDNTETKSFKKEV